MLVLTCVLRWCCLDIAVFGQGNEQREKYKDAFTDYLAAQKLGAGAASKHLQQVKRPATCAGWGKLLGPEADVLVSWQCLARKHTHPVPANGMVWHG